MTGMSMNSRSSAKSTIWSNFRRMSSRGIPSSAPLRYTFSRPVRSGWNPAPSSSSDEMRPRAVTLPSVGEMVPATSPSNDDLPAPFGPMTPTVRPGGIPNVAPRMHQNGSGFLRKPAVSAPKRVGAPRPRRM